MTSLFGRHGGSERGRNECRELMETEQEEGRGCRRIHCRRASVHRASCERVCLLLVCLLAACSPALPRAASVSEGNKLSAAPSAWMRAISADFGAQDSTAKVRAALSPSRLESVEKCRSDDLWMDARGYSCAMYGGSSSEERCASAAQYAVKGVDAIDCCTTCSWIRISGMPATSIKNFRGKQRRSPSTI